MKPLKTLAAVAMLALLTAGNVRAADGDKAGAKPEKGDKREHKAEVKVSKPDKRTLEHIEQLNGKALSDEQMKTVEAAWEKRDAARKAADDAFKAEIAQSLGLTADQIAAKEKELREAALKDNADAAKKEGETPAKKDGDKPAAP